MGGKFHLKLNICGRPIVNKYREGKTKRTLKREWKVLEIAKREAMETSDTWGASLGMTCCLGWCVRLLLRAVSSASCGVRSGLEFQSISCPFILCQSLLQTRGKPARRNVLTVRRSNMDGGWTYSLCVRMRARCEAWWEDGHQDGEDPGLGCYMVAGFRRACCLRTTKLCVGLFWGTYEGSTVWWLCE